MNRFHISALACAFFISCTARATDAQSFVALQDLRVQVPSGWALHQNALSNGTVILGFHQNEDFVNLYVSAGAVDAKGMFGHESQLIHEANEAMGPLNWKTILTSRTLPTREVAFVKGFWSTMNGHAYFGYAKAGSKEAAIKNAEAFLAGMLVHPQRSLTDANYTGKKYYFGWGAAMNGDPSMMHNEVKYDVLHTHDIFTKSIGGDYIGTKLIGPSTNGSQIKAEWNRIKGLMTAEDMFVQYSSGHGSTSGLAVGVNYNDIRDNALSYPAKEIIIFTMACHSGGLVDAFNAKKSVWENWQSNGRTLFVMASSPKSQTSSTGPGTDSDESGGPNGSAGSAFGHGLWKALIGYADGYVDGVKDGFLSLGEIRDYATWKTNDVGGHKPVHTGAYVASLIMNKKPSREYLESLEGSTEGMTDAQIMERIQELDSAMRVGSR